MKLGIIGCGNIMKAYGSMPRVYPELEILACADIDVERARAVAAEWSIPRACTVEELLADPDIQMVVNLTIPRAHAEIDRRIVQAGKHCYSEKPLALERAEIDRVLGEAAARGLRVGCAPDTFLGGGYQTVRHLIDDGAIGRPVGASAAFLSHGPEHWHPRPHFVYERGGGPLFDMGPYYLTALVNCLGPVRSLSAVCAKTHAERMITSQPLYGTMMPVEVDTHVQGVLEFAGGAFATVAMSFDVWNHQQPWLQIWGTEGSLVCPDPNGFRGPVRLSRRGREWEEIPLVREEGQRGIGAADMAAAILEGRPHRASAELAYHVLDVMQSLVEAGHERRVVELQSTCQRPEAMPATLTTGAVA